MNLFEVGAFAAFAVNFLLTAFVLIQRLPWILKRTYLLWGGGVAVWNFAAFFMYQRIDEKVAFFLGKDSSVRNHCGADWFL